MTVSGYLWQRIAARLKQQFGQKGNRRKICYAVWFEDSDKKTGGGNKGDKDEMFRFSLGVMKMDMIRKIYISEGELRLSGLKAKLKRKHWDSLDLCIGRQSMLDMELRRRRERGRLQRMFLDGVTEDLQRGGLIKEGDRNRVRWRQMTCNGDLKRESARRRPLCQENTVSSLNLFCLPNLY